MHDDVVAATENEDAVEEVGRSGRLLFIFHGGLLGVVHRLIHHVVFCLCIFSKTSPFLNVEKTSPKQLSFKNSCTGKVETSSMTRCIKNLHISVTQRSPMKAKGRIFGDLTCRYHLLLSLRHHLLLHTFTLTTAKAFPSPFQLAALPVLLQTKLLLAAHNVNLRQVQHLNHPYRHHHNRRHRLRSLCV